VFEGDYHPKDGQQVRITFLGADDKLASDPNALVSDRMALRTRLYRAQAQGDHRIGRGVRNAWQLSLSYFQDQRDEHATHSKLTTLPVFLKDELTLFADRPLTLRIGADTVLGYGKREERYDYDDAVVEGDRFQAYPALYTELLMTTVPTCELVYGIRFDDFGPIEAWGVDPRFAGACKPFAHTRFKGGLGLFHQSPTAEEMDEDTGNPKLDPSPEGTAFRYIAVALQRE
jgi:hypothetical protein